MKIESILLENFRQYYGTHVIEFSTSDERPVTIIHGENGAGKSHLLSAIKWVLYGDIELSKEDKSFGQTLIHTEAKAKKKVAKVELRIRYEGNLYLIVRNTPDGTSSSPVKVFLEDEIEGGHEPIPEPVSFISKILPKELSRYFLFAGEGISKLGQGRDGGGAFIDAVKKIYGFAYVELLLEDLEAIIKEQSKKLRDKRQVGQDYQRLLSQQEALEEAVKAHEVAERANEEELKALQVRMREVNNRIDNSGHKEAENANKEIQRLKKIKDREDDLLRRVGERERDLIPKHGWAIFSKCTVDEFGSFDFSATDDHWINAPWDELLIERIIKEEICICGRSVEEGSEAARSIIEKLRSSQTNSSKEKMSAARATSAYGREAVRQFLDERSRCKSDSMKIEETISGLEGDIREKNAELQSISQTDIRDLKREKDDLDATIGRLNQKIGSSRSERLRAQSELRKLSSEIAKASSGSSAVRQFAEIKDAVESVEREARETLKVELDRSLAEINKKLKAFIETQPVDLDIHVDSDYSIRISNSFGPMTPSEGESLMINLIYVSALISTAAERVHDESQIFSAGVVAPFVIDAPFGAMDQTYSGSVVDQLIQNAGQLIIFVSSTHWNPVKEQKVLLDHIGAQYFLEKHVAKGSAYPSEISQKPVEIRGKVYQQVKLGAPRNQTVPIKIFGT